MEKVKKLPEAELEVMLTVCQLASPVTADAVMEKISRAWGKTTLLNLMTRLCQRGFLACRKEGRVNLYTPLVEREEYLRRESDSFLHKLHAGSLTGLVASLYDGKSITKEDLAELRRYIDEAE